MMFDKVTESLEQQRVTLQADLDKQKTQVERNRLGQFATPTELAIEILAYAKSLVGNEPVSFLDPAIGTGAFFSALIDIFPNKQIEGAVGFEIDPHYGVPASRLLAHTDLNLTLADFTRIPPEPRFNLVICNPPYVRHHHLSSTEKARLYSLTYLTSGMKLSGLAGLYCHFIGLTHGWMKEGGLAGWLVPSEFMDVNYGKALKHYLLNKVTLIHIHRFDPHDVQFADALVSSAVVWIRKSKPPQDHTVTFSYGGRLLKPSQSREVSLDDLALENKWTRFPAQKVRARATNYVLSDFFHIKRGLVTGDNRFFILDAAEITARDLPMDLFRPILPSPRQLPEAEVHADDNGTPLIDKPLFLLDTRLMEQEIQELYPSLYSYLEEGRSRGVPQHYICRHRSPWYAQEVRPPAPIVCTYLGRTDSERGHPFRFILNWSRATVSNVYLALYPIPHVAQALERSPDLIRRIWSALNNLSPEQLIGEGRIYGGGLHKLEPGELANVDASAIAKLLGDFEEPEGVRQLSLFDDR